MSITAAAVGASTGSAPARGRTTVAPRALDRVVSGVTAELFSVPARAVRVDLSDRHGLLEVRVRTPVRVVSLQRIKEEPGLVQASGGTLLQRAAEGQKTIRERVSALTGAAIAYVTIELTGIDIHQEKRVK